jgi:histidinol phosphatase-like enzyme
MLDAAYYCPHAPSDECGCRKPSDAMLRFAARDLGLLGVKSYMVGDKMSDVVAGQSAGCRTILLGATPGHGVQPDATVKDWREVVRWIVESFEP